MFPLERAGAPLSLRKFRRPWVGRVRNPARGAAGFRPGGAVPARQNQGVTVSACRDGLRPAQACGRRLLSPETVTGSDLAKTAWPSVVWNWQHRNPCAEKSGPGLIPLPSASGCSGPGRL